MTAWMNLGQQLKINAKKYPDKPALKDKSRSFTFSDTNRRVNQLANGLTGLGLTQGDKVAVMMDNSIEIVELYMATAKTGIIIVPINFRLVSREVAYIVDNSDAKALFVQDTLAAVIDPIRTTLNNISPENYFTTGEPRDD
ncbi:MAG: AMP-binding protein, partial [Deltaproteobacteria bacterium]|nr:AMP-binding protein [Deltaproteobacteria bacterium]